ncbi:C2H2-type zinc finger protein [Dehalococcoidia bacterium]|nr:C2H2-type zinc finger protein [Dehalococcoidia bacterium]
MFTCSVCGKKFKTMQALGGHMSAAHAHDKTEDQPPAEPSPPRSQPTDQVREDGDALKSSASEPGEAVLEKPPQSTDKDKELGVMDSIRELRNRGYSPKQVREQFEYPRQTVDQVFAEYIPPEGKVDETRSNQDKKRETMPAVYKKDERSNPEVLLQGLADGDHEAELEFRGMMKLRAAMLMVMDLMSIQRTAAEADALRIKPILDLMKETRLEQDAAAARAKESSVEIADRAAYEGARILAEQVVPEVRTLMEKQKPAPAGKTIHDRMFGPIADMMGQQMGNMFSGMFGISSAGQQPQVPPGWEYEEVKGE